MPALRSALVRHKAGARPLNSDVSSHPMVVLEVTAPSRYAAYLRNRRAARRVALWALLASGLLFSLAMATRSREVLSAILVTLFGFAMLAGIVSTIYLSCTRCPRCSMWFTGHPLLPLGVTLFAVRYLHCQSCGLDESNASN
jgi:hypothetical protein